MLLLEQDEFREQKSLFGVITEEDADDLQPDEIRPVKSLFETEPEQGDTEMQTLGLSDEPKTEERKSFWHRQFQAEPTRRQKQYDWLFGVIMPSVCIFFDPLVFRAWIHLGEGGLLGAYRPFAYTGSFISVILMMTWLLWREKLAGFGALIAGVFFIASTISLAIGIVLMPFSLFGLIFLIGALGFTPLFTSVIFLRNGVRAMRAAKVGLPQGKRVFAAILGAIWGLTIPYVLNVEVARSLDLIARGTPGTIRAQGLKLRLLSPLVDPGQLQQIYLDLPQNSAERSEVGNLYFQLTGQSASEYRFDW